MKSANFNTDRDKYLHVSKLGTELNLSFSSHLSLGNKILALDGIKKKLLVCEFKTDSLEHCLIDLRKVRSLSIRKIYGGIKAGELNERKFEDFIKTIHLHFEHIDVEDSTEILFYEKELDNVFTATEIETIIKKWQIILSKIMGVKGKEAIKEIDFRKLQPLDMRSFPVTTVLR